MLAEIIESMNIGLVWTILRLETTNSEKKLAVIISNGPQVD